MLTFLWWGGGWEGGALLQTIFNWYLFNGAKTNCIGRHFCHHTTYDLNTHQARGQDGRMLASPFFLLQLCRNMPYRCRWHFESYWQPAARLSWTLKREIKESQLVCYPNRKTMVNNELPLFKRTNQERPYEQLLNCRWGKSIVFILFKPEILRSSFLCDSYWRLDYRSVYIFLNFQHLNFCLRLSLLNRS